MSAIDDRRPEVRRILAATTPEGVFEDIARPVVAPKVPSTAGEIIDELLVLLTELGDRLRRQAAT